jgi:hypothetical protein
MHSRVIACGACVVACCILVVCMVLCRGPQPPIPLTPDQPFENAKDCLITVIGTATSGYKQGGVVVRSDGYVIHPAGLDKWEGSIEGKVVRVTGILRRSKDPPPLPEDELTREEKNPVPNYYIERFRWQLVK